MKQLVFLAIVFLVSCGVESEHTHDENGAHVEENKEPDVPSESYTIWTDKGELFVEFPALTVDKVSRFIAHFTRMADHKPVTNAKVTVSLVKESNGIRQVIEKPKRDGIFTPSLKPVEAGIHNLVFEVESTQLSERFVIEDIEVYPSVQAAIAGIGEEKENENKISFLKEQAWRIDFKTEAVEEREVFQSIPSSGVWEVAPSDHRIIAAPASGRIIFEPGNLTAGSDVKKGQVLMTISSEGMAGNNLQVEFKQAKARYEKAKAAYDRKLALNTEHIVSSSDLEQAREEYEVAEAAYSALRHGYSVKGKLVRVPFDGYVKSIDVINGGYVKQGASLITLAAHNSILLEVQVSPSYARELEEIQDLWYQPEPGRWSSLKENGGRILSVRDEVEEQNPMISLYAEVNEEVHMPEGSYSEVELAVGNASLLPTVPIQALMESYGYYSVIVQSGGESYERRDVRIGKRNGRYVEVLSGLRAGEMVVSKGAYQVKMQSMSGEAPAHGHAH